ncbi:ATP-dependent Clp protease ATP-binding subunit [Fibrella forsythiae]|uniref:ATP-dependent Clp protease ATP-binding subunit n=1 Tax=Fibrella forsythiae TaxID=2817061 RepID=A0ABS3JAY8_9BACT|nr:ATP-dependent Clp protease ATP-binding subunit [Fibrella forsythiae]MBO0947139.1 ATP-dependent Clp protease ATP-binding subunit [Fibrella forsythiae]
MLPSFLLSEAVQTALYVSQSLAREYRNERYSAAHLLRALVHADSAGALLLTSLHKDVPYLREWAEVRMEESSRVAIPPDEPAGDQSVDRVMDEADVVRVRLGLDKVEPICVLTALTKPGLGFPSEQLRSLPLQERDLLGLYLNEMKPITPAETGRPITPANPAAGTSLDGAPTSVLQKYCTDKTALARSGHFDPIIGRERELRMMVEILGRRSKPNVMLTGDPGVGKSALIDGLAQLLITGLVPGWLKGATLLELDPGALLAGASYKGEVEDRLKNVIKEVKAFDKCILFIDEIHVLLDPKGGAGGGAANLLKPELARGELTLIGATTRDEFRKLIEPDQALSRRFELLNVDEPPVNVAERMIRGLVGLYEKHHQLTVDADVVPECVRLAKRYVKDRRLPDAALDLLDRTMAAIRTVTELAGSDLDQFDKALAELNESELTAEERLDDYRWFDQQLQQQISPVLMGQWEDPVDPTELVTPESYLPYLTAKLTRLHELADARRARVSKTDLAAVVAYKTGIPMGKVQEREKEKLLTMEDHLRQRVVGQDHALKALSDAILESRSGLQKAGQPIGTFFLLGPTGTGKTELSKSLAEFLFNDEHAMIRFDMSEFKEEHAAALLYGAPPGYVGYEEGGLLVNRIRQQPYAVVLFDEIEKAHSSIFDVFLQIMDEGRLHDKLGKEGDFSNALLIFTSNIGSEWISHEFQQGRRPSSQQLMERMTGSFRPEFLARITEIVPFSPITEQHVLHIFDIQLRQLTESLQRQGIRLELDAAARQQLAFSGYTPQYGARPLAGVIRNKLRRPISRMIIAGQIHPGEWLRVTGRADGELSWQVVTDAATPDPIQTGQIEWLIPTKV